MYNPVQDRLSPEFFLLPDFCLDITLIKYASIRITGVKAASLRCSQFSQKILITCRYKKKKKKKGLRDLHLSQCRKRESTLQNKKYVK